VRKSGTVETPALEKDQLTQTRPDPQPASKPTPVPLGVVAIDDSTLIVSLIKPDKDLPKLLAHPIFRPIYGDGSEFDGAAMNAALVTNGAFKLQTAGKDGIELAKSETYWNAGAVSLDAVRFVPKENAEAALDAYRLGEVDAVTNADFEPLVLKLLSPYDDFRQTPHSALNFYEIRPSKPPFSDRRIRQALALSIDRERLAGGELENSVQAAASFLPLSERGEGITFDLERARTMLAAAGYEDGQGFPKIRLLVNRNDTQQRVAKAVTRMWKQNLNLDAEITVKEMSELDTAWTSGEFDVMRRGVVLPTADEAVSIAAILGTSMGDPVDSVTASAIPASTPSPDETVPPLLEDLSQDDLPLVAEPGDMMRAGHAAATSEFTVIPLYFPVSYALVKPYVKGFDTNALDAPLLSDTKIDSSWRPRDSR
jgi:oligopeptide transport system substrate-binding protein